MVGKGIADQLKTAGVQLLLGEEVQKIEPGKLILKTGRPIDTDTVIWTAGLEASPLTASLKGERDELGRLCVDRFLRLPAYPDVFAAGDVAKVLVDDRNYAVMSCQTCHHPRQVRRTQCRQSDVWQGSDLLLAASTGVSSCGCAASSGRSGFEQEGVLRGYLSMPDRGRADLIVAGLLLDSAFFARKARIRRRLLGRAPSQGAG